MLKAAIFDMDGLLIDSEPFWRKSHIEILGNHDVIIGEDEVRAMAGKRTDEVVEHWREKYQLKHIPSEALETSIVTEVIEHIGQRGLALPGAKDLLEVLRMSGLPIAIASSSAPEVIEAVVNKLDINEYLSFAYSAKYEKFGKPHPGVFLTTAVKLDVAPEDCVVFEDSVSGITAAKAAGMKCVAVPEVPNRQRPEVQEADLVLDSLAGLSYERLAKLWD